MTRILSLALLAFAASFAIAPPAAWAVSPSEAECDAQQGTFTREQGEAKCVVVEEGKNTKFTDTQTDTGRGNLSNKEMDTNECGGTGSGKCPPGQFPE
jgi:hypothetical protein